MKKTAAFFISLLVSLIFLELYLQVSEIQTPLIVYYDDKKGRQYYPNKIDASYKEGFGLSKTNELGYFFPTYKKKTENDFSISLISDSYINARYMFDRHHLRSLLEKKLNHNMVGNKTYRVLRFGQVGGKLSDFYIQYIQESKKYDNELTFIFIDNEDLIFTKETLVPSLVIDNNKIKIDYSFNTTERYILMKKMMSLSNSSVLRLVWNSYKQRDLFLSKIFGINNLSPDKVKGSPVFLSEINKKIFNELKKEKVVLVFKHKIDISVVNYLKKNKVNYLNLEPVFERMKKNGVDPYYWKGSKKHGHWNHAAQIEISNFLYDYIYNNSLDTINIKK